MSADQQPAPARGEAFFTIRHGCQRLVLATTVDFLALSCTYVHGDIFRLRQQDKRQVPLLGVLLT